MHWKSKVEKAKRPCLQFSGGKDSLACLQLLKPWHSKLIVLWSNPGDPFPEALALMETIKPKVAEFHEVRGNALADSTTLGLPADIVPVRSTPLGQLLEPDGKAVRLRNRYECCWSNFWLPTSNKARELGVDLLIRGQRDAEELRAPVVDGSHDLCGAEIVLPIKNWSEQDVMDYLRAENVEIPRFYESMHCSVDCMHCTAYVKDTRGKVGYLRKYHPEVAKEYEYRMGLVAQALMPDIHETQKTLEEIHG